ncbi:MAG: hypothetical protein ACK4MI_12360 [Brevundimonas sp.]|nr:hypothetical protein [uncultured Brevundimonas sp.]
MSKGRAFGWSGYEIAVWRSEAVRPGRPLAARDAGLILSPAT